MFENIQQKLFRAVKTGDMKTWEGQWVSEGKCHQMDFMGFKSHYPTFSILHLRNRRSNKVTHSWPLPDSLLLRQLIKPRQDFVICPWTKSSHPICDWKTLISEDARTQGRGLAKFSQYISNRSYHLYFSMRNHISLWVSTLSNLAQYAFNHFSWKIHV